MFSPKSSFPEWTCMGHLFIAAQGKILDGFRELVTQGKVSFMGLCARQENWEYKFCERMVYYVFMKCNSYV